MRIRLLISIALLLVVSRLMADDWQQFRGPRRDGVSTEKGLLKKWPEKGPKLVWSFKDAGLGFSSMAIVGDKLYTLGTDLGEKNEVVLCLDAAKGTKLWTVEIGPIFTSESNKQWGDGPRSTPTIDGERLYALGGQGILVCLDIAAAEPKELWRKDFKKELDGVMMDSNDAKEGQGCWGYSESPLVDGKLLICTPGGPKGTVAALDKMTGAVVWRSTELNHDAPYTSVMPAVIQGVKQYIQCSFFAKNSECYVSGFSALAGKVLWSHMIVPKFVIYDLAPTPIVHGNLIYQTTWHSCHLLEIDAGMKVKDLYPEKIQKTLTNNHGGVVKVGDHVYGRGMRGWVCQAFKTGKQSWEEDGMDVIGQKSASLIGADGMLYLFSDRGEVGLAEADAKEFTLMSEFKIPQRSKYIKGPEARLTSQSSGAWAYPVIANGRLYLRDGELIFCYDIRK